MCDGFSIHKYAHLRLFCCHCHDCGLGYSMLCTSRTTVIGRKRNIYRSDLIVFPPLTSSSSFPMASPSKRMSTSSLHSRRSSSPASIRFVAAPNAESEEWLRVWKSTTIQGAWMIHHPETLPASPYIALA